MEYILCAAIYNPGETDMGGHPLIYCGFRHHNILWQSTEVSRKIGHQGFLTSTGRFVNRKEAFNIAETANQLNDRNRFNNRTLFSEDLY